MCTSQALIPISVGFWFFFCVCFFLAGQQLVKQGHLSVLRSLLTSIWLPISCTLCLLGMRRFLRSPIAFLSSVWYSHRDGATLLWRWTETHNAILEVKIDPSQPNVALIYVPAAKAMSVWYKWITVSLENVSDVSAAHVKNAWFSHH